MKRTLSEQAFWDYYREGREDNSWDYKTDLDLSSKKGFAEFVKDVLAFANYGGGYLLLGVDGSNGNLVGVEHEYDQAALGQKLEKYLGLSLDVQALYFDHVASGDEKRLGLIYIPGSRGVLTAPRDLHDSEGKLIIRENDVFYRRNTSSRRASSQDHADILARVSRTPQQATPYQPSELLKHTDKHSSEVAEFYSFSAGRYEINARVIGRKLKEAWNFETSYSKAELADLLGIALDRIDDYLEGRELLDLPKIITATKVIGLPWDYFFQPTFGGHFPCWYDDIVRYAVLSLAAPKRHIARLRDPGAFYSEVIWGLARGICRLHEVLWPDESRPSGWQDVGPGLDEQFRRDLATQYYKLLEQYPRSDDQHSWLESEQMVRNWQYVGGSYLARLIIEGIASIGIEDPTSPLVSFRFDEDIARGHVDFQGYDEVGLVMTTQDTDEGVVDYRIARLRDESAERSGNDGC